jgi:hypothetical protein
MIGRWLSVSEIAELTGTSNRWTQKRAINEHWVSRNEKANGGIRRIYQVSALPADIQTAYAESLKLGLTELQSRIEPPSKHEKKVIMANHSARSDYGAEAAPQEKASAAKRRTASLRVTETRREFRQRADPCAGSHESTPDQQTKPGVIRVAIYGAIHKPLKKLIQRGRGCGSRKQFALML